MPYGQPLITENEILCEECGKWKRKLTANHLKMHGLTIPEYKEKWGLCKTQPLESLELKRQRQEYSAKYKTFLKNLVESTGKRNFKKGETTVREVREQERIKLAIQSKRATEAGKTPEAREKRRAASVRFWKSEEYRAKQAAKFAGRERNEKGQLI
jgi:hypothetical protein